MEHGSCNTIYFDPRTPIDATLDRTKSHFAANKGFKSILDKGGSGQEEIEQNVRALLANFKEGTSLQPSQDQDKSGSNHFPSMSDSYAPLLPPILETWRSPSPQTTTCINWLTIVTVNICKTAESCVSKIQEHRAKHTQIPTLLLIYILEETYHDKAKEAGAQGTPPSVGRGFEPADINKLCGVNFLRYINATGGFQNMTAAVLLSSKDYSELNTSNSKHTYADYFAFGASDVLKTPLTSERASSLPAHAFRTLQASLHNDIPSGPANNRRSSWVGVDETKPYAYLRESMVSGLMDRICDPDYVEKPVDPT